MSNPESTTPYIFMMMKEDDVIHRFANMKGSFVDGKGKKRFVYNPGTRKNKVLLVAHCDTVFGDNDISISFEKGAYSSKSKKTGIGADDRAGCAVLWELKDMGHSLLVVSGEESGCQGSSWMMDSDYWKKEINDTHQFVIQIDRRDKNDIVFYDVGSPDFTKWLEHETGYKKAEGSCTDIRKLCRETCGVNFSTGYYNEHTSDEKLVYSEWVRTINTIRKLISKDDLPKFTIQKIVYNTQYNNHLQSTVVKDVQEMLCVCRDCHHSMTYHDLFDKFHCPKCKEKNNEPASK